jgi:hypothetical protein
MDRASDFQNQNHTASFDTMEKGRHMKKCGIKNVKLTIIYNLVKFFLQTLGDNKILGTVLLEQLISLPEVG